MVKIINTGSKLTRRRLPNGRGLSFVPNKEENSAPKVGGGVKTHVKPSKPRSKPTKSKIQDKVDKLDKPKKGLKKNKKAKKGKAD